jgi:hypothetical protein
VLLEEAQVQRRKTAAMRSLYLAELLADHGIETIGKPQRAYQQWEADDGH